MQQARKRRKARSQVFTVHAVSLLPVSTNIQTHLSDPLRISVLVEISLTGGRACQNFRRSKGLEQARALTTGAIAVACYMCGTDEVYRYFRWCPARNLNDRDKVHSLAQSSRKTEIPDGGTGANGRW